MITHGKTEFGTKTKGYTLHEDEDDRVISQAITFPTKFAGNPIVLTGFSMLDVLIDSDTYVQCYPPSRNCLAGFLRDLLP